MRTANALVVVHWRAGRRQVAIFLFSALMAGCAARRGPESAPPPVAAPAADANEILRVMNARRAGIRSMRALARMVYTSPETSHRARQVILASRPDRLRWEVLSPFGTAFVLAAHNGTIAAYAPGEDELYRGTASATNLARYAGVDLSVPTVVDLLLGTPPLHPQGLSVVSQDGEQLKLWQSADDMVTVCWFSPSLDPVRFERHDDQGHVLVVASFGTPVTIDGNRLPTRLTIEIPASGERIGIELRDPEVNPDLADDLFALQTPPGVKEIDIDRVNN